MKPGAPQVNRAAFPLPNSKCIISGVNWWSIRWTKILRISWPNEFVIREIIIGRYKTLCASPICRHSQQAIPWSHWFVRLISARANFRTMLRATQRRKNEMKTIRNVEKNEICMCLKQIRFHSISPCMLCPLHINTTRWQMTCINPLMEVLAIAKYSPNDWMIAPCNHSIHFKCMMEQLLSPRIFPCANLRRSRLRLHESLFSARLITVVSICANWEAQTEPSINR